MTTNLFITGASGFVGGAITAALRDRYKIHALSRSPRSDQTIEALGATPVRGELGAVRREHLASCDTVIHCAAYVKQWGSRDQFWQANVEGTEQLLRISKESGVRRFIHIGTEAALFYGQHMRDIDETYPYPESSPFLYSATKAIAERRVLAANAPGFETLSIRPRFVWGPGDQTILPAMIKMVKSGQFAWIDGGKFSTSTTHIANLVHGVTLALENGKGGNPYFIVDTGNTTLREFLTALLKTRGIDAPDKTMPSGVAGVAALMTEIVWRLFQFKSEPPLTRFAVSMMSHDCTIKSEKAVRDLHYQPVIARERGLAELTTIGKL